eukprot:GHVT01015912.1.p1 GENE.GHVT01015912.1~~GHVT01015912.1.p1  ORF type:complete len:267 (-),score=12.00 GHVT01015912.1:866-1666(-)
MFPVQLSATVSRVQAEANSAEYSEINDDDDLQLSCIRCRNKKRNRTGTRSVSVTSSTSTNSGGSASDVSTLPTKAGNSRDSQGLQKRRVIGERNTTDAELSQIAAPESFASLPSCLRIPRPRYVLDSLTPLFPSPCRDPDVSVLGFPSAEYQRPDVSFDSSTGCLTTTRNECLTGGIINDKHQEVQGIFADVSADTYESCSSSSYILTANNNRGISVADDFLDSPAAFSPTYHGWPREFPGKTSTECFMTSYLSGLLDDTSDALYL